MKILLLGSNGQVGQAIQELSQNEGFPIGWSLTAWDREEGDLSDSKALIIKVEMLMPDAIINAAAYTQVDRAETDRDLCSKINAEAPGVLAQYCKAHSIPLVHYSSDYVYEGSGTHEHTESEALKPSGYYGETKARGDRAIIDSQCEHLIFRTSWVYSHTGKNFVKTMIKLASERPELKVVSDQIGSPTYAPDLAKHSFDALMLAFEAKVNQQKFPSGVYHLCNSGLTSWCDFAKAIIPKMKVIGILTSEYPTPAKRPLNSRLSLSKIKSTFGINPRPWQVALKDCLQKLGSQNG